MTFEPLFPPPHMARVDEEVFNMEFGEFDELLGEVEFQAISSESMAIGSVLTTHPISPKSMPLTNDVSAMSLHALPSLPVEYPSVHIPFVPISPANSVSGESDDDGASHNVEVQNAHVRKKKAATRTVSHSSTKDDPALAKKKRRREKNREHAKKCRTRKKDYVKGLEDSVVDLKSENLKLRRILMTKFRPEDISALMQEPTISTSQDFLQSLRDRCSDM
jgi:hypothetical protein